MIRQAISCDICGAEKRQTNHWFVAYTNGGELRVTGWSANSRMRAGSKHLCGQTCVHKLVDEFIAGTMSNRAQAAPDASAPEPPLIATDASLTSNAAYANSPGPGAATRTLQVVPAAVIAIAPARGGDQVSAPMAPHSDGPSGYGSPRWQAEAWERERERERRAALSTHRKTS